ncbi:MAG: integrin alpha [Planctomycetota bacterium]
MHRQVLPFLFLSAALAPAAAQAPAGPFFGESAGARLGSAVERVGDVDNDGTPDFATGAPFSDETIDIGFPVFVEDAGSVSIYSGDDGQLIWRAQGPLAGETEFGAAIANAGDVDWDGRDDVLVGLPSANGLAPGSGSVQLLSGLDGSVIQTYFGSQTDERFGASICAGQMDLNIFDFEVAIGAPDHDADGSVGGLLQEGRVEVFDLFTGTSRAEIVGVPLTKPDASFLFDTWIRRRYGAQLAYVGDANGTGYGALVVSAPFTDHIDTTVSGTETHTFAGSVELIEPLSPEATVFSTLVWTGNAGDQLGSTLAGLADDMNGDGGIDFAFYTPGSNTLEVWAAPATKLMQTQTVCIDAMVGLASIGDANMDGTPDLAAGVPELGSNKGHVCLISGSDGVMFKKLYGSVAGSRYGTAVAGRDMDGDGASEIWIGAPFDDSAFPSAGAVDVRSEFACATPASWTNYGVGTAGTFGVPTLTSINNPVLGAAIGVTLGSVTTGQTKAVLLLGVQKLELTILGGTVLVQPFQISNLTLPEAGGTVGFVLPYDPSFCGVDVYLQALQLNPDAPEGWAFSPGLQLTLGS